MAKKNQIISSVEELKELSKESGIECFIRLNHGFISSKHIWYDEQASHFEIINYIDDSEQCLNEKELFDTDYSHIGKAIQLGSLYIDN